MTDETLRNNISRIEEISVGELIRHLKIAQLWAVIGIIAGVTTGAFVLGFQISNALNEADIHSSQIELSNALSKLQSLESELASTIKESENYRRKDRFLSLFLNYQLEKEEAIQSPAAPVDLGVRKVLDDYVLNLSKESEKDYSFVEFGKGHGR